MATEFQRAPQEVGTGQAPPLTWDYAKRLDRKPPWDKDLAFATCRNGHTLRMSGSVHAIAADGTVTPSYVCVATGCDFHEWVRFVGWDPGHEFEYVGEDPA